MTDRLTPGQLRDLAGIIAAQVSPYKALMDEAARRKAEGKRCHAAKDGECIWSECPQARNYLPTCPLIGHEADDEECAAAPVTATGPGAVATGQHPDANTPARPDAPVVTGLDHSHSGDATAWMYLNAPPPPAPGEDLARIARDRRQEGDNEAADAIEALRAQIHNERMGAVKEWDRLRARAEAAEARVRELETFITKNAEAGGKTVLNYVDALNRAEAAEAENKTLREALEKIVPLEPTGEEFTYMGPGFALGRIRAAVGIARAALAGGNDG